MSKRRTNMGMVVIGAVTVTGLAVGASSATAFAAEAEIPVQGTTRVETTTSQINDASLEAEAFPENVDDVDVPTAESNVAAAESEAAQADGDLRLAEGLRDGTVDIAGVDLYQDEQAAGEAVEYASALVENAVADTDRAEQDLADAEAEAAAAEDAREAAAVTLVDSEESLAAAEQERTEAEAFLQNAMSAYEQATADAAEAAGTASDAEEAAAQAESDLADAERNSASADAAVEEAESALEEILQNADAAAAARVAEIEDAEDAVAVAENAAEEAQTALEAVDEQYRQGTLGLIDWMLSGDGLSKVQIQDLQRARQVLLDAVEEDFSQWAGGTNTGLPEERGGKVVVIGDERDATNLENLLRSIAIMRRINELRATDDNYTGDLQRSDSYTNFFFMATAEAGAMRGAGLRRHSSLTVSCEDLAFGYSDPTVGWYTREKAIFDRIRDELGITQVTSTEDLRAIKKAAAEQDVVIGHYTNLMWAADQVMGVGYTDYSATSCYNAANASTYANDKYNRGQHMYTIDEFEALVMEYYRTVDKTACQEAADHAEAERAAAAERLQTLLNEPGATADELVQSARDDLAARQAEAERAVLDLANAGQAVAEASNRLEAAKAAAAAADRMLAEAQAALDEAGENSRNADMSFDYSRAERDAARQALENATEAAENAQALKQEALERLMAAREAEGAARAALDTAEDAYAAAAEKLAEFTSEDAVQTMSARKTAADQALEAAKERLAEANRILAEARARAEANVCEGEQGGNTCQPQTGDQGGRSFGHITEVEFALANSALARAEKHLGTILEDPFSTLEDTAEAQAEYIAAYADALIAHDQVEQADKTESDARNCTRTGGLDGWVRPGAQIDQPSLSDWSDTLGDENDHVERELGLDPDEEHSPDTNAQMSGEDASRGGSRVPILLATLLGGGTATGTMAMGEYRRRKNK